MLVRTPSILFIDAYDSFTNNIVSLLSVTLSCSIRVIHIDSPGLESDEALCKELRSYDAVVCGPGPGDPRNEKDVGLMRRIWALGDEDLLPVLGICLGFQSLAVEHGAPVRRLERGLHGMVRRLIHVGDIENHDYTALRDIFEGVGHVDTTLYHSLCIDIGQDGCSNEEFARLKYSFQSRPESPLLPLAWVVDPAGLDSRILMAIRHKSKPFWGLQYHPESICTNEESKAVIRNWFKLALEWNKNNRQRRVYGQTTIGGHPQRESLLSRRKTSIGGLMLEDTSDILARQYTQILHDTMQNHLEYKTINLPEQTSVPALFEHLCGVAKDESEDYVLLDSTNSGLPHAGGTDVRGRYSILALDVKKSLRIEYRRGDRYFRALLPAVDGSCNGCAMKLPFNLGEGIWDVLSRFSEDRHLQVGNPDTPFWGGFMGYTTYEFGLEGIDVQVDTSPSCDDQAYRPDVCFAWITSSIVLDHRAQKLYVQNLTRSKFSTEWLGKTTDRILTILAHLDKLSTSAMSFDEDGIDPLDTIIEPASSSDYERKVTLCQGYIADGNSYELCLTDQSHILRTHAAVTDSWAIYKRLRCQQPAPMASFLRLGTATFISGSPERFLKWDESGLCELRPMKGTVKKTDKVTTLRQAEELLQVPKERAENLMIVDLVRHDLHSVCGAGNVEVPRLMVVEEYASVFQMITVVQGQIPQVDSHLPPSELKGALANRYTGIDVLAASLPPGSMTGAPKKRSCEILQGIENTSRSLYSGVVGYIDVGGRGDFSVNIRCLFKWDDERVRPGDGAIKDRIHRLSEIEMSSGLTWPDVWHVGAGGAVTALSTPVGEREEMQTKAIGTLRVFGT